jgi:hypothetical protein
VTETPGETRVYVFHGAVAHLLAAHKPPNGNATAVCGRSPVWFSAWLGTGSQAEYEKAAGLPTCAHCAKLVAR